MNGSKLINFIVSYVVIINMITIGFVYVDAKTDFIKINEKAKDAILFILSLLGGFIGTILGSEMLGYKRDDKIITKWIKRCVILEVIIICIIIYLKIK